MKKLTLSTLICLTAWFQIQAQRSASINGKIISAKTKEPVAAASISLTGDSLVYKFVAAADGSFKASATAGTYTIKIEAVNYETILIKNIQLVNDTVLATISLQQTIRQLNEVTVVAAKSDIELKADKKIFNVGKDILSKGGNANDILNNVPSVNVDVAGNISLRGNGNVRVLINGKPSMLTANNGLMQIPAASIEKVEVITNPSSAYEAQGSAGIINIILKKNSQQGFNASLQASAGTPANNSVNANMSYKTKKFNLFSNIGYRYAESFAENRMFRQNKTGNLSVLRQLDKENGSAGNTTFYLGGDYYFNDKNTLTGSYFHNTRKNKYSVDYNYNYFNSNDQPDSSISRSEKYREPQLFNELELNYVKTFKKPGKKWSLRLLYDFWNDDENQQITQQTKFPATGNALNLVSRDIESSDDIFIQSDYVAPLKNDAKLEMGVRADLRAIRSDYKAYQDGSLLDEYDNKLYYDENIYAAYIQYGSKIKKLGYLAGLRSELSNIQISDRKNTINKTKNYINFFPTLHLQYSLQKSLELQLSYSRRINRPRFWQLNSFAGLSDTRFLTVGNPDLDPMYTDALELGILKKAGKLTINPSVYYQQSTGYFDYVLQQTADGNFVRTPVNLGSEKRYGAELNTIYNPYKWWRLSLDFNYYGFTQEGQFKTTKFNVKDNTWFVTLRSGMKFPKVFSMDMSFNYRGANKNVQTLTKPQYRANTAISKDLLNDKMSVTFAVNNIFNSQETRQLTETADYLINGSYKRLRTQYTATVVYRFNRKKNQADRLPAEK